MRATSEFFENFLKKKKKIRLMVNAWNLGAPLPSQGASPGWLPEARRALEQPRGSGLQAPGPTASSAGHPDSLPGPRAAAQEPTKRQAWSRTEQGPLEGSVRLFHDAKRLAGRGGAGCNIYLFIHFFQCQGVSKQQKD